MSFFAEEVNNDNDLSNDVDDVVTWKDTDKTTPQHGEHLNPAQIKDIQSVWQEIYCAVIPDALW